MPPPRRSPAAQGIPAGVGRGSRVGHLPGRSRRGRYRGPPTVLLPRASACGVVARQPASVAESACRPPTTRNRPPHHGRAEHVDRDTFEAVNQVTRDNSKRSPRRAKPGQWMLRGLVKCAPAASGAAATRCAAATAPGTATTTATTTTHQGRRIRQRCPERNIRADALDTSVFDQVRAALLRPDVLATGEQAVAAHTRPRRRTSRRRTGRPRPPPAQHPDQTRRLVDLYQTGARGPGAEDLE